ncbi:MAG: NFACT family protein [Proteobacteria bacterium]|nr:NFACT family protein [Pseudomonadota bacterium]
MNHTELTRIIQRLSFDLIDARLDQITDGDNRLQLAFKRYMDDEDERRRFFLIIDFLPSHLDIYPTTHPKKAPAQPQAFTMLLRKYIGNQMLTGMRIAEDDRIVTFDFGYDETTYYALIVELTGRSPKVFLIESDSQKILGCIGKNEDRGVHDIYFRPQSNGLHDGEDRFRDVPREDIYQVLDGEFSARDAKERTESLRTHALKRVNRSLSKTVRLTETLSRDLYKAEAAELERLEADLLNAYAYQLKQGMHSVDLPDFETGQPMRISLDPALSIRENIEKRYAHAKRMIKSRAQIQSRLASAQERKGVLEDLRQKLDKANDASIILELSPEIDAACAPDEKNRANAPQKSKSAVKVSVHKPYKTFKSADGTLILVGKSAKDNDDLTFHHTRGNDTWLHVSGMPGSHVVVKSAEPSQETLIDAALLAMHYSKLARADRVEVHVTQVKYVRKPKGAPDGKVEIRGERAILARASEKRLARLMQTEC